MTQQSIVQEISFEHELLGHIADALRAILDQRGHEDVSGKLFRLRFVAESLYRHLDYLLELEEGKFDTGEMYGTHLPLGEQWEALWHDQSRLCLSLDRLAARLEKLSANDQPGVDQVCRDLLGWLEKLDRVQMTEEAILQQQRSAGWRKVFSAF